MSSVSVFIFYTPGLIFGGTGSDEYLFHVLRSRTRFRWYRVRRVSFSCFALPDSFSAVPRASGPVFMFYAPELIFGGTEDVGSRFHVLRSQTHFRRYQGRRVPFSCFALPDSVSTVPRASGPIFMFCSRTRFRRHQEWRVPFSCCALLDSFSAVSGATCSVFMFCPTALIFISIKSVRSYFMFCAFGLIFGGIEGVSSSFHVLRSRTHFPWYRGRRVPFLCFALLNSFSTVPRASGPVFIFCAPRLVFGCTGCDVSRFHISRAPRLIFRPYRVRHVMFACFACSDSFSAVPTASGPVFMFARTRFRRYRGRRLPFSCFAISVSFPVVPRASGHVFMF
jgi:hypothetical protein